MLLQTIEKGTLVLMDVYSPTSLEIEEEEATSTVA